MKDDVIVLSDDDGVNGGAISVFQGTFTDSEYAIVSKSDNGSAIGIGSDDGNAVSLRQPSSEHVNIDEREYEQCVSEGSRRVAASAVERSVVSVLDASLMAAFDGLEEAMRTVFTEQGIPSEVRHSDGPGMCVRWKMKAFEDTFVDNTDAGSTSDRYEVYWRDVTICIDGLKFNELVEKNTLLDFIDDYSGLSAIVTLAVYGSHNRNNELSPIVFEAFEKKRTQIRFICSAMEMALMILRSHRSIARWKPDFTSIFERVRGRTEGLGLTTDWWMKMLMHVHRLGSEERRALVARFPDVFDLAKRLRELGEKEGTKLIAGTRTSTNRCIGPVISQKIFLLLTSDSGLEIVDDS
uniref:Uncharacterized protein n=1 Tax=Parascaris univalens TaxID=6257 RepID=A0A915BPW5_PARUN